MKDLVLILLSGLSHYLINLVGLLSGPKSFVRRLNDDNRDSLVGSFTFFGVSFALYSFLLAPLLPPNVDFLQRTISHAVFSLLAALCGLAVLHLSWRIVGGKAPFNRQLITYAYYSGVGLLIAGASVLFLVGAGNSLYPAVFESLKALAFGSGSSTGTTKTVYEHLSAMARAGDWDTLFTVLALAWLPYMTDAIWVYIGWGAFRELNLVSKRASAAALVVTFCLSWAIVPLLGFIARAMHGS